MNFERARTSTQIENRIEEILNCAIALYESEGLEKLNFLEISKKTKFTRPTIYKYFKTKEEIMLMLVLHYMHKVTTFIETTLSSQKYYTKEAIAHTLTQALVNNPEFVQLYSILFTIIEKNVSVEALSKFKVDILAYLNPLSSVLQQATNCTDATKIYEFLLTYLSLAIGLYPMCFVSDLQKEAIALSNTGYVTPVFEDMFQKNILVYLDILY